MADACGPSLLPKERPSSSRCRSNRAAPERSRWRNDTVAITPVPLEGAKTESHEGRRYDSGPGLPAHLLDTLITPFVTTKTHGLGIGLTVVQSIVHAYQGTIAARNNPGGGATFTGDTAPPPNVSCRGVTLVDCNH
jgi:hypothetical protein